VVHPGRSRRARSRGVVVGLFRENCWWSGRDGAGRRCVIDPGDEPEEIWRSRATWGAHNARWWHRTPTSTNHAA